MDDKTALTVLRNAGYVIRKDFTILLHKKPTEEENKEINYLCDEWDYSIEKIEI